MTDTDKTFLHNNRRHYDMWKQAQIINQLDGATRTEMLAIIRRNFAPRYMADLWCQSCVTAMLEYLYTQYDTWQKQDGETLSTSTEGTTSISDARRLWLRQS